MKKMMGFSLVIAVVLMSIVSGCTSTKVITTFMEPEGRFEDQSILLVGSDVLITTIDGYVVEERAHSGSTWISFPGYLGEMSILLLAPGEHTINAAYFALSKTTGENKTTYAITQGNDAAIFRMNFQASLCYAVTADKDGNRVTISLNEVTDPDIGAKAQKEARGAKKPKEYAFATLTGQNAEPTKFEGTWVDVQTGNPMLTFKGNTWSAYKLGTRSIVGTGEFTFTDTEISLNMKVMGKIIPSKNIYRFNDDGTIYLKTLATNTESTLRKE
jgi:hypothetical protein